MEGFEGGAACGTRRKHPRHGEVVVAEVGGDTILGGHESDGEEHICFFHLLHMVG